MPGSEFIHDERSGMLVQSRPAWREECGCSVNCPPRTPAGPRPEPVRRRNRGACQRWSPVTKATGTRTGTSRLLTGPARNITRARGQCHSSREHGRIRRLSGTPASTGVGRRRHPRALRIWSSALALCGPPPGCRRPTPQPRRDVGRSPIRAEPLEPSALTLCDRVTIVAPRSPRGALSRGQWKMP